MNKAQGNQFIKYFLITFSSILILYFIIFCLINPYLTAPVKGLPSLKPYHLNFILHKFEKLTSQKNKQILIIGSSTSEAFNPMDIKNISELEAFSASTGGGATPVRYIFFKQAIKNLPKLKKVIYVADFFEFNQPIAVADISFTKEIKGLLSDTNFKSSYFDYLKHVYNNQTLEALGTIIKRRKKNKITYISNEGLTNRSMILSPIKGEAGFKKTLSLESNHILKEQILENTYTYRSQVLKDYRKLNDKIQHLYQKMANEALEKNIELIFILSPYHFEFKKNLFQDKKIKKRFEEWVTFMATLKNKNVKVCDWALESSIARNRDSAVWRDGIHFNRESASVIIRKCLKF